MQVRSLQRDLPAAGPPLLMAPSQVVREAAKDAAAPPAPSAERDLTPPAVAAPASAPGSPGEATAGSVQQAPNDPLIGQPARPLAEPEFGFPTDPTLPRGPFRIILELTIAADGRVEDIRAEAGDEVPLYYIEATKAAFAATPFAPARSFGQPVVSRPRIEVTVGIDPPQGESTTGNAP